MFGIKLKPSAIVIAILCIIVVILLMLQRCGSIDIKPDIIKITIHDTIPGDPYPVTKNIPVPVYKYRDTGSTKWRDQDIDTNAILTDYFATYYYDNVLQDDTSAYIRVSDSISQNKVRFRSFTFQNRRPIAINSTTTITNNKKESWLKFYMGIGANYSPSYKRFGVGPFATATIRPGAIVGYGYDAVGNSHQLSFGWKLRFKK